LVFGVETEGGYFLSTVPMLALGACTLIAKWLEGPKRRTITAALMVGILLHGLWTLGELDREDSRIESNWGRRRHLAVVHVVAPPAVVLSADLSLQLVSGRTDGIVERALWPELYAAVGASASPDQFSVAVLSSASAVDLDTMSIVLDCNWTEFIERNPEVGPYMDALAIQMLQLPGASQIQIDGLKFIVLDN